MPQLPIAFSWALSGSAVAPASGKQAVGWLFAEPPPSSAENWLQQQNGRSATFLAANFANIDGDMLTLGVENAGLRASDDGSVALFELDGSSAGLTMRFKADEVQTPLAYIGGPPGGASTVQLSSGTQGGSDARVLVLTPQGGTLQSAVRAGVLLPTATEANLLAAGFPRDAGVYEANFPKAYATFLFERTGAGAPVVTVLGATNCTVGGSGASASVTVTDRAAGTLAGKFTFSVQPGASPVPGGTAYAVAAVAPTYNAGTGVWSTTLYSEAAGVWEELGATGARLAYVSVTIY